MSTEVAQLTCPYPDCGEALLIDWHLAYALDTNDLAMTRQGHGLPIYPADSHAVTWSIGCMGGHILLTPGPLGCGCPDEGDECTHDEEAYDWSEDVRFFRPHDRRRLDVVLTALGSIKQDEG